MLRKIKASLRKKAQIGETLTWIIATVAILIILVVSIFIVSTFKKRSFEKVPFEDNSDLIASKSLTAYLLTNTNSGESVFERIKNRKELDDYTGNLAINIFRSFYEKEYPVSVWLGVNFEGFGIRKNSYFGSMPTGVRGGDINRREVKIFSQEIKLNDDKEVELILMNK